MLARLAPAMTSAARSSQPGPPAGPSSAPVEGPPRAVVLLLAVACGATVANLYYAQPLLGAISAAFGVGEGTAALAVTFTQLGYAAALLFVLPTGDLVENRALVTRVLLGTALALAAAAAAPSFWIFAVVAVMVGITSVVAQILVPFAAHLAPEDARGRVVGQVMSGLLLGILLARTVASLVADVWGWRAIYVISAVLMLVLAAVLRRVLPERRPEHTDGYRSLLASVVEIGRTEPVLRARALCQGAIFGSFTAFWTAIAYELHDEHGLSQAGIGLFALVGAAGAAAAPVGGRLADSGRGRSASGLMLALASIAVFAAGLGSAHLWVLALGAVVLDLAAQSHQVMSQQEIYALRPEARARINTVFMGTVFASAAASSAIAGALHTYGGWSAVCWFAGTLPLLGLAVWAVRLRPGAACAAVSPTSVG